MDLLACRTAREGGEGERDGRGVSFPLPSLSPFPPSLARVVGGFNPEREVGPGG